MFILIRLLFLLDGIGRTWALLLVGTAGIFLFSLPGVLLRSDFKHGHRLRPGAVWTREVFAVGRARHGLVDAASSAACCVAAQVWAYGLQIPKAHQLLSFDVKLIA